MLCSGSVSANRISSTLGIANCVVLRFRHTLPHSDIYENALKCGYPSASDLIAVWLAYCDFLLRVIRNSKDSNLKGTLSVS